MSVVAHDNLDKKPTRKHIAERQRRARINHLLEQLENLIFSGDNTATTVKLEKAEVLERTVEYVKQTKDRSHDRTSTYISGFMNCMQSVGQFLKDSQITPAVLHSIQSHLLSDITRNCSQYQRSVEKDNVNNTDFVFTNCEKYNGHNETVLYNFRQCFVSEGGSNPSDDSPMNSSCTSPLGTHVSIWRPW